MLLKTQNINYIENEINMEFIFNHFKFVSKFITLTLLIYWNFFNYSSVGILPLFNF